VWPFWLSVKETLPLAVPAPLLAVGLPVGPVFVGFLVRSTKAPDATTTTRSATMDTRKMTRLFPRSPDGGGGVGASGGADGTRCCNGLGAY
jgi:hypothetical protein